MRECPECGLPVEGAFDDAWDGSGSTVADADSKDTPELASAIPPAPESGNPRDEADDAPARLRLVVIAAIAALCVVGGTALYITRPWDPNAYVTHALEETEVEEAEPPKGVSHLSGQDLIEDAERTEYLKNAEATVDELVATMDEASQGCSECEAIVGACLAEGELPEESRLDQITGYADRLSTLRGQVAELDLRGSTYEAYVQDVLVASQYLIGRVETLRQVWEALDSAIDATSGLVAAESKMASGYEGRSLEEWRGLYNNAHAGLEVKKQ